MFDFLFGAKKRRRTCRKKAPRRRYKSSNASCNRSTKKACRKPACRYASGRKYYGCVAAPGFANAVSGSVPQAMVPVVAEQVQQAGQEAAAAAASQGASPTAVVAAAAAAAADQATQNANAAGAAPEQVVAAAVVAGNAAAVQAAEQVGLPPAQAEAVVQQVDVVIAEAAQEAGAEAGLPPAQAAAAVQDAQETVIGRPANPGISVAASAITMGAIQRAREVYDYTLQTEARGAAVPKAIQDAATAAVEEAQVYLKSRNVSSTELFQGMVQVYRVVGELRKETAAEIAAVEASAGGPAPPPNTPPPPSNTRRQRLQAALAGVGGAVAGVGGFGRRRSRFGSVCSTLTPSDIPTCLNYRDAAGMHPCNWSGGSNNRCQNRAGGPVSNEQARSSGKYAYAVRQVVPGLANVYIPPPPRPVMAAPQAYIFGSAQMAGPGPGRAATEVRDYCKRFNLSDCREQLNCEVWGDKCQAKKGAGAAGYESRGLKPNTRWSGPIARRGFVRTPEDVKEAQLLAIEAAERARPPLRAAPAPAPTPARAPARAGTTMPPGFRAGSTPGSIRDPLFDYMPAEPGAPPRVRDPLFDFMFGARRKSRKVSLKALKAKCRRLGVRTTTGKNRKPKTIAQLKRQCALKSPTRCSGTRRKYTRRASSANMPSSYMPSAMSRIGPGAAGDDAAVAAYCKRFGKEDCDRQLNCQYIGGSTNRCQARRGTGAAGGLRYRGPLLPRGFVRTPQAALAFGRRRCKSAPRKRRINSKSPCNSLKKKDCKAKPGCGYVSTRKRYGCKRKPVYASAFGRRRCKSAPRKRRINSKSPCNKLKRKDCTAKPGCGYVSSRKRYGCKRKPIYASSFGRRRCRRAPAKRRINSKSPCNRLKRKVCRSTPGCGYVSSRKRYGCKRKPIYASR